MNMLRTISLMKEKRMSDKQFLFISMTERNLKYSGIAHCKAVTVIFTVSWSDLVCLALSCPLYTVAERLEKKNLRK